MKKQLQALTLLVLSMQFITAQTGNETLGDDVTPESSVNFYDGILTLGTPGLNITLGDYNTLLGDGAGTSLTNGSYNVFLGAGAGAFATASSNDNTFIGAFAGDQTSTNVIIDNVVIGTRAARTLAHSDNVVIGAEAGRNMTAASDNVIIGEEAGEALTIGDRNIIIGEDAGFNLTEGSSNCLIGRRSGYNLTTGSASTFVGGSSSFGVEDDLYAISQDYMINGIGGAPGEENTTGLGNTFIGSGAGSDNGTGHVNTFVGYGAGYNNEHGDGNTFIGYGAGYDNNRSKSTSNANRNTYVGMRTGGINREGSDNVGMGYYADFNNNNRSRTTFMGALANVDNNDVTMFGYNTRVSGQYGIAIGSRARVNNPYSIAIGTNVTVAQDNTMALGGDQTLNRLSVGIGTVAANANASLELADTDKGFLVNRLTTAQRNALETTNAASGAAIDATQQGLMVYDTDLNALTTWDGTAWHILSPNTDAQDLALSGTTLNISNGTGVDLSVLQDGTGTDAQAISLSSNTLSISGNASTVDLTAYLDNTDAQNLTSASLSGTTLTVAIENGNSVNVDLAPILSAQQTQINDLISRIEALEACACSTLETPDVNASNRTGAILYQNVPNPAKDSSRIGFFLPITSGKASIIFTNTSGQTLTTIPLNDRGEQEINVTTQSLTAGVYYYTLIVDGKKIDTKKMIIN